MAKEELIQEVDKLCKEAGEDYLFVLTGQSSYQVTNESNIHLRRLVITHNKLLEREK